VTLEDAKKRAHSLDMEIHARIGGFSLESPHKVVSAVRAYLIRRAGEISVENNPWKFLKFSGSSEGAWLITMGPTIDRGDTEEHFHFDTGARLSFGLTLQEEGSKSRLLSFRYQYNLPDGKSPRFLRFDLNRSAHADPLQEPLCHLHPGLEEARLPFFIHSPLEILDRIFFVIDKNL